MCLEFTHVAVSCLKVETLPPKVRGRSGERPRAWHREAVLGADLSLLLAPGFCMLGLAPKPRFQDSIVPSGADLPGAGSPKSWGSELQEAQPGPFIQAT